MTFQAIDWRRLPLQILVATLFAAGIGYFSNQPSYRHLPEDRAVLKLSLRHAGQIVGECRERSAAELAGMPENMRAPLVCPRERSPLELELRLNNELVLSDVLPARGIHKDGRAAMYRRIVVPTGELTVNVRLKDRIDSEEFQYQAERTVQLSPAENLVIDFNGDIGDFEFNLAGRRLSEKRAALEYPLDDLEAGDGKTEDDEKVDQAPVGERLTSAQLDETHDPVGQKIEPDRDHREQQNLTHGRGA